MDRSTWVEVDVSALKQGRDAYITEPALKPVAGTTAWCIDAAESDHYAPSAATFMVNYRVEDLDALVKALREEGCNVLGEIVDSEYGLFAWVLDPEGNKVELWQPPAGQ